MNVKRRIWKHRFIASVMALLCLTGCWDMIEVNRLAIVNFVGMDLNPEQGGSMFYYQIINPTGIAAQKTSGINAPVYTYSIRTSDSTENPSKLTDGISKTPFFAHYNAMVVTERAARKGLVDQLNFLEKQNDRQSTIPMIITDSPLQAIMRTYTSLERLPGRNARLIIDNGIYQTGEASPRSQIKHVAENLESTILTVLPIISLSGEDVSSTDTKKYEMIDANKGSFLLKGGALIKQGKMIGRLKSSEMPYYNLLNGQIHIFHQSVPLHEGHVDLRVEDFTVRKKLVMEEGKPVLRIHLKAEVHMENNTQDVKLDEANLREIKSQLDKLIREKCERLFAKSKKNSWDITGLEAMMKQKRGQPWAEAKRNPESWKETQLDVTTQFIIQTFGNTLDPYKTR
ncbi:Ger(x)C family spore germination protein [Paenibacillus sp. NPDC058174]|uniref:Ger(x)C family spore germination protein n=1 Tax=Paenibacillus sp. NPDC058174 TaxID=3346366 RepID=UPI0036DA9346